MNLKRIAIFGAVATAVIAAFVWAFRPQPVAVDLATVAEGDLEIRVADEGLAKIAEVYVVSAPVAGTVLRTPVDPGDAVMHGRTVVAAIEPARPAFLDVRARREIEAGVEAARAALALAEAEVTRAEAEGEFWRSDLIRQEMLRSRGTIAQRALEESRMQLAIREAALETARATVRVRESELRRAEAQLTQPEDEALAGDRTCCLQVRSPVTGRVLDVMVESETVVRPGDPLLSVGDPDEMEIVVDLLSSDAVRVQEGDPATIERWGGPPLRARVRKVEPAGFEEVSALGIDEQRVRVRLDIESPPEAWRGLGHDYRVFVSILAERHEDVLTVPIGAIFRDGADWAVFIVEEGRAALRRVALGAMNDRAAQVLDGLVAGEAVILHPSDRIADRVAVTDRAKL
jgi:HlyD family secretion protein